MQDNVLVYFAIFMFINIKKDPYITNKSPGRMRFKRCCILLKNNGDHYLCPPG